LRRSVAGRFLTRASKPRAKLARCRGSLVATNRFMSSPPRLPRLPHDTIAPRHYQVAFNPA
jgi:hypothetical protein